MLLALKIFYFVFGFLTIGGGFMGFLKARSTISLVAGVILGVLLIAAAIMLQPEKNVPLFLGLVASLAIAGKFIPDLITHQTIFPAGVMAALSVISLVLTLLVWYPR